MFKCRLLPLLFLLAASAASPSDSVQKWSSKWDVYVSAGGCAVSRAYADQTALVFPDLDSPELQIADYFEIRFHVQTAPETIKSGGFDIGNLYLWVYTKPEPVISKYQQQITGVRIDSYDLSLFSNGEEAPTKFQLFFLGKEDTFSVWKSFLRQDPPIVQLHLADGSTKEIEAPAGPRDLFDRWARILRGCSETDIPTVPGN